MMVIGLMPSIFQSVVISSPVQLVGAAPGLDAMEVMRSVVVENTRDTTISFTGGSLGGYLGYMTVLFNPDRQSATPHVQHYALQLVDETDAVVDHCLIHSSSFVGAAVAVKNAQAHPRVRHCVVSDCENVGIFISDNAMGRFEDCEIARNNLAGVWVKSQANPQFKRCHIHHGRGII